MNIQVVETVTDLRDYADSWNDLAGGVPHLQFEWLTTWWNHRHLDAALHVILCRQQDTIVGIAPLFIERSGGQSTLQFLGSDRTCSDHLTVMAADGCEEAVAEAVAEHLLATSGSMWTNVRWIGVDADDTMMQAIWGHLRKELMVHCRPGVPCYDLDISAGWEAYLRRRSKSTRRKIRRMIESIDTPDYELVIAETDQQLAEYWPVFQDLHQKRRLQAGTDHCFQDPAMADFLESVCQQLVRQKKMLLAILHYRGKPAAAEVILQSDHAYHYYQSGMDPEFAEVHPGLQLIYHTIKHACDQGKTTVDLLRGDEAYKPRLGAELKRTTEIRIAGKQWQASLRHQLWIGGLSIKNWLQSATNTPSPEHSHASI